MVYPPLGLCPGYWVNNREDIPFLFIIKELFVIARDCFARLRSLAMTA